MLSNVSFATLEGEPMSTPDIDRAIEQLEAMLARRHEKHPRRQPFRENNRMDRPINSNRSFLATSPEARASNASY